MERYRICKNKYGFFKVEMWYPPKKIFFMKFRGRWKDSCFRGNSKKCNIYTSYEKAQKARDSMIVTDEMENNEWHKYVEADFVSILVLMEMPLK